MEIINMTPHDIVVYSQDGTSILATYPSSGKLIRLESSYETKGELNGTPLVSVVFGEPMGLPEYKAGTFYLVSAFVKEALPGRRDLLVPSMPIRDKDGRIIGCTAFGV